MTAEVVQGLIILAFSGASIVMGVATVVIVVVELYRWFY